MVSTIHRCVADGRYICLDVERGRYFEDRHDPGDVEAIVPATNGSCGLAVTDDLACDVPDATLRRRWLLPAALSILLARLAVRTLPFRTLIALAGGGGRGDPPSRGRLVVRHASWLAARRWLPFRKNCLPDSLALLLFLRWTGAPGRLVIGVTGRPFTAHCWVVSNDVVVNEPAEDVRRFTPILDSLCPLVS